jgi:hypothetical protein
VDRNRLGGILEQQSKDLFGGNLLRGQFEMGAAWNPEGYNLSVPRLRAQNVEAIVYEFVNRLGGVERVGKATVGANDAVRNIRIRLQEHVEGYQGSTLANEGWSLRWHEVAHPGIAEHLETALRASHQANGQPLTWDPMAGGQTIPWEHRWGG